MANSAQARKRVRQANKQRLHHTAQRSRMRTLVKNVLASIQEKNAELAKPAFLKMQAYVDSLVNKGLLHRNKAARLKSRLNKRLASI